MKQNLRPMHILIVDDDETDRELFTEAAVSTINGVRISEAGNGREAMEKLGNQNDLPDLIVLDLNMPIMDGRETLRALKSDSMLRSIPVCILSTSSAAFDISRAYDDGANVFQVKPLHFNTFQEILKNLHLVFGNTGTHYS